uniref:Uncharacterized protein n=1 Tax=Haptolina brevifila TaxID=156173 RepID=A0A7S2HW89_9EUKA|mmetsp:Transcript_58501/g.116165  ORF Transcript_58501/g.116165 Transcript_58501/m.116165 type:complete len:140 (+) Transcript_58501:415-834(+)
MPSERNNGVDHWLAGAEHADALRFSTASLLLTASRLVVAPITTLILLVYDVSAANAPFRLTPLGGTHRAAQLLFTLLEPISFTPAPTSAHDFQAGDSRCEFVPEGPALQAPIVAYYGNHLLSSSRLGGAVCVWSLADLS